MQHEIDRVLAIGDGHQKAHWKVYYGVNIKQQTLFCSSDTIPNPAETVTWELSRPYLETFLKQIPEGTFTIQYKDDLTAKTDIYTYTFRITLDKETVGVNGALMQQQQPAFNPGMYMQLMQAEIKGVRAEMSANYEKEKHAREIADLQKELKDVKKEKAGYDWGAILTPIAEPVIGLITQYVASQMANKGQAAIGLLGHNAAPVPPVEKAEQKEVQTNEQGEIVVTPELAALHGQTTNELINFFGSPEEMILNLAAVSELLKESPAIWKTVVEPMLKPYKEKINGV